MKYTFLEVNLKFFLRQERDDARCDKVDEALRVVVDLILQRPLALRNDQAEYLDLTLSILISITSRLPVAWDAL